jgi:putative PIN family toxin of toxin-antitoxin system
VRVVLDTNVLVAGLLSAAGPPGWIVEAALAGEIELVFDAAMRQEYEEVLRRPELDLPRQRVDDLFAAIDEIGWEVTAVPPWPEPLPDPEDEPFLAVAAATGSVLVTGNLRHFPQRLRRGVDVRTPRQLFDQLRPDH